MTHVEWDAQARCLKSKYYREGVLVDKRVVSQKLGLL